MKFRQLLAALGFAGAASAPATPLPPAAPPNRGATFYAYRIQTPQGPEDALSFTAPEVIQANGGLMAEEVFGHVLKPADPRGLVPENFARNKVFVDFMHDVIARRGPEVPNLVAAARQQVNGWVYVIDARNPTPQGRVLPEDIIGAFEVIDGQVSTARYQRGSEHRILSNRGLFVLDSALKQLVIEELEMLRRRQAANRKP